MKMMKTDQKKPEKVIKWMYTYSNVLFYNMSRTVSVSHYLMKNSTKAMKTSDRLHSLLSTCHSCTVAFFSKTRCQFRIYLG